MEEIVKNEFEFYSRLAKPLVLNMPKSKDRILAAAWIKKFRDPEQGSEKLRTTYLKLLLFCLQRRQLSGIFADDPAEYDTLEDLPPDVDLNEFARNLLEQEAAERREKIRLEMIGDMDVFPAFITDCSPDLTEYVAAQDIPNFGVHVYYAISKQPVNKWQQSDNAIFPKGTRSAIDTSISAAAAAATSTCVCIPKGTSSAPEVEEETKEGELPLCRKPKESASPEKKKRRPKKLGTSPPSRPIGEVKHSTEERITPTWGTNLIEIREHTNIGNIDEPTEAEKALELEASQMMKEEEEEEEEEVEEIPKDEDTIASKADQMLYVLDEIKTGKMDGSKKAAKKDAKSLRSPSKRIKKTKTGQDRAGTSKKPANLPEEFKDWTEKDLQIGGLTWDDLMTLGGKTGDWKVGDELDLDAMLREAEADLAASKTMYDEGVEEDEPVIELFEDELAELEEQLNALKAAEDAETASPAITSGIPVTTPQPSASPRRVKSPEKVFAEEDDDLLEHRVSPLRPPKAKPQASLLKPRKSPSQQTDQDPNISKVYEHAQKLYKQQESGFDDDEDEFEKFEREFQQEERSSPSKHASRSPLGRSGGVSPGAQTRTRSLLERAQQQEDLLRTPDPHYDRFADDEDEFEKFERQFQQEERSSPSKHASRSPLGRSGGVSPGAQARTRSLLERAQQQEDLLRTPDPHYDRFADDEDEFEKLERQFQQEERSFQPASRSPLGRSGGVSPGAQARTRSLLQRAQQQEDLLRTPDPDYDRFVEEFGNADLELEAASPLPYSSPPRLTEVEEFEMMEQICQQEQEQASRISGPCSRQTSPRLDDIHMSPQDYSMDSEGSLGLLGPELYQRSPLVEEGYHQDVSMAFRADEARKAAMQQEILLRQGSPEANQIINEAERSFEGDVFKRVDGVEDNMFAESPPPFSSPEDLGILSDLGDDFGISPMQVYDERTDIFERCGGLPEANVCPSHQARITSPLQTVAQQSPYRSPARTPTFRSPSRPPSPPRSPPQPPPMPFFPGMSAPLTPPPQRPLPRPQLYRTPPLPTYGPEERPCGYMSPSQWPGDYFDVPDQFTDMGLDDVGTPDFDELPPETPEPYVAGLDDVEMPDFDELPPETPEPCTPCGTTQMATPRLDQGRRAARLRPPAPAALPSRVPVYESQSPVRPPMQMRPRRLFDAGPCRAAEEAPQRKRRKHKSRGRPKRSRQESPDFEEMERQFEMQDRRAPCGPPRAFPPSSPGEAARVRERAQQQEDLLKTPPTPEDDEFQRLEQQFQLQEGSPPCLAGIRTPDPGAADRIREIARQQEELLMQTSYRTPMEQRPVPSAISARPVRGPRVGTPIPTIAKRSRRLFEGDDERRKVIEPAPAIHAPCAPTPPQQRIPSPAWSTPSWMSGPSRRPTGRTPPVYDSDFSPPPTPPKSPKFAPAKRIRKKGKYPAPPPSPRTPADQRTMPSPCMTTPQRVPYGGGAGTPARQPPPMKSRRIFEEPGQTPRQPAPESPVVYSPWTSPCPGAEPESPYPVELIGDITPPEYMSPPPPPTLREDQMYYPPEMMPCGTPGRLPTIEELRKHQFVPDRRHERISYQTAFGRVPMSSRPVDQMDRIHEYESDAEYRQPEKKSKRVTYPPRKFTSPKAMSPPLEVPGEGDAFGEILWANLQVPPERYPPPELSLRPTGRVPCTSRVGTHAHEREKHEKFMAAVKEGTLIDRLGQEALEDIADQADLLFDYEGGLFNISPPPGDEFDRNYYPDIERATDRLIQAIYDYDLPELPDFSACRPTTCGAPSRTQFSPPCGQSRVSPVSVPRVSPVSTSRTPPTTGSCQAAARPISKKPPGKRIPPKKQLRETRSTQLRKEKLAKQQQAEKEAQMQKEKVAKAAAAKKKKMQDLIRKEQQANQKAKAEAQGAREPRQILDPKLMKDLMQHEIDYPGYSKGIVVKGRYMPMQRRSQQAFEQMDYIEEAEEPVDESGGRPRRSPVPVRLDPIQQIMAQSGIAVQDELDEFEELERQLGCGPVCARAGPSQPRFSPTPAEGITYSPPRPRPMFGAPPRGISPQHLPIPPPSSRVPTPPSPPPPPPEEDYLDRVEPPIFYDIDEAEYLDDIMPPAFEDMDYEDRLPWFVKSPPPPLPRPPPSPPTPPPSPPLSPAQVRQEVISRAKPQFDPGLRGDVFPRHQRRIAKGPCSMGAVQEEEPLIPCLVGHEPFQEDRETRRRRKDSKKKRRKKPKDEIGRFIAELEEQFNLSPIQSPGQEYSVMDETPPSGLPSPMSPQRPPLYPPIQRPPRRPITPSPPRPMYPFSPPYQQQMYTGELPIQPDTEITEGICQLSDEQPVEDLYFTPPRYPEIDQMERDRVARIRYQLASELGDVTPPSVGRGPCGTYTPADSPSLRLLESPLLDRPDDAMLMTPPLGSDQQDIQDFFAGTFPLATATPIRELHTPPSAERSPCRTCSPDDGSSLGLLESPVFDRPDDAMMMTPPPGSDQLNLQEFFAPEKTEMQKFRDRMQTAQGRRGIKPQAQYFGGYGEAPKRLIPRWYNIGGARDVIREVEEPVSPPTPGTPPPQFPEPSSRWSPTLDEFERLEREAEEAEMRRRKPSRRAQRPRRLDFDEMSRRATLQEMAEEAERVYMEYGRPPSPTTGRTPSPSRTPPHPQFDSARLIDSEDLQEEDNNMDLLDQGFLEGYEPPEEHSRSWERLEDICDPCSLSSEIDLDEEEWREEMEPERPQMLDDETGIDTIGGYQTPPGLSPSPSRTPRMPTSPASLQMLDEETGLEGYQTPPRSYPPPYMSHIPRTPTSPTSPQILDAETGIDVLGGYRTPPQLSPSSRMHRIPRIPSWPESPESSRLYPAPCMSRIPPSLPASSQMLDDETGIDLLAGYRTPPQLSPSSSAAKRAARYRAQQEAEEARRQEYMEQERQELREMFGPSPGPPSPGPDADFFANVYAHHVPEDFLAGGRQPCYVRDQIGTTEMNIRLSRRSRAPNLESIVEPRPRVIASEQSQMRRPPSTASTASRLQRQVMPTASAQRVAEARRQYQQTTRLGGRRTGQVPSQQPAEEMQGACGSCQAPQFTVEEAQKRVKERIRERRRQQATGPQIRAPREMPPPPPPSEPSRYFMPRQVQMQIPRPPPEMQNVDQFVRGGPRVGTGPQQGARPCRAGQGTAGARQRQGAEPQRRGTKPCERKR